MTAPVKRSPAPSLWPPFLLVVFVTALVGSALWVEGFTFNPVAQATNWALHFSWWLLGVAAARFAWLKWRRHRRGLVEPLPWRRQVRSIALAVATLALLGPVYSWAKVLIPFFRTRTFDAEVYRLELAVHLGIDPGPVSLAILERVPWAATLVDWSYLQYVLLLSFSVAWFVTTPDLGTRNRFVRGFVLLWLSGLAIYWAFPTLGPVYVFEELRPDVARLFPGNHALQMELFANYGNVLRVLAGEARPIQITYGIAAMPSLHVALPAYLTALSWERRSPLRVPYLVVTVVLSIGCVATGWHYLVDAHAGILLALLCWLAVRTPRAEVQAGALPGRGDGEADDATPEPRDAAPAEAGEAEEPGDATPSGDGSAV